MARRRRKRKRSRKCSLFLNQSSVSLTLLGVKLSLTLASTINKALSIPVLSDSTTQDLYRGIRQQLASLLGGVEQKDLNTMSLGLGHSMSRFKLKFSTDKVDTMVIQAIALLDDLDKEINIYSMRVKVGRSRSV